jgi:hypothetical protein
MSLHLLARLCASILPFFTFSTDPLNLHEPQAWLLSSSNKRNVILVLQRSPITAYIIELSRMSFDSNDLRQRMSTNASDLLTMAAEQMETAKPSPRAKPMSVMRAILGECMCETFPFTDNRGLSQTSQFIELHGVECISLGAVVDELSPEQRIRETLEQLTAEPKRMISIGYLVDEESPKTSQIAVEEATKVTETVDLDVWRKNYPDDKNMSKPVAQTIKHIEVRALVPNIFAME